MVSRVLALPCRRWQPDEVLDLAVVMLWSLHAPGSGWLVGLEIGAKFTLSPGGRGRSRTHGEQPRNGRALAKFAALGSGPRWNGKHRDSRWPLTREVANAVMLDAIHAFLGVLQAERPDSRLGLIERAMPIDEDEIKRARDHADRILHVLLRRIRTPWRSSLQGRKKHPGLCFTLGDVEALRAELTKTCGPRVSYRRVAQEMRGRMRRSNRPSLGTIQNRISKLLQASLRPSSEREHPCNTGQ